MCISACPVLLLNFGGPHSTYTTVPTVFPYLTKATIRKHPIPSERSIIVLCIYYIACSS